MVALQILVLSVWVRVLVKQQGIDNQQVTSKIVNKVDQNWTKNDKHTDTQKSVSVLHLNTRGVIFLV